MAENELVDLIKDGLNDLALRIEESRRETREQDELDARVTVLETSRR